MDKAKWIPVSSWKKIPEGLWLVALATNVRPYQVAYITRARSGEPIGIIGHYFAYDTEEVLAYCPLDSIIDEYTATPKRQGRIKEYNG